jgi:hypothetical protein
MSRLRLKDEPVAGGVQTFLKLALFLPDDSCLLGRTLLLTLIVFGMEGSGA